MVIGNDGYMVRHGTSLLDLPGFGQVGVASCKRANGQIIVIAHPNATMAEWDRVWDRLPDIEVEEFDYHIKPDGTEVYIITPGLMVSGNR